MLMTLVAFGPSSVLALGLGLEKISIDVNPPNPKPLESVNVSLNSFSVNLGTTLISWFVNEKLVASGIGQKKISVRVGVAGSSTNILAKISLDSGEVEKTLVLKPASVVLLWEAQDSYVPPFYKGKAMASAGSLIKVVALPEIKLDDKLINLKSIVYEWKKDHENTLEGAVYGKDFFLYQNDYLEDSNNISVLATTLDKKNSASANTNISATEPKIVFYRQDSQNRTIWEKSVGDGHKVKNTEVLVAVPYFISPKEILSPLLIFTWSINDYPVSVKSFIKHLLPLKTSQGSSGRANIKLEIENKYKLFQRADQEINVEF
jgi:hypothetical protein